MRKKTVNIVSLDSKVDVANNYALQCVAKYYHSQGWRVLTDPSAIGKTTLTYLSLIFSKSRKKAEPFKDLPNVFIGGTGWDIASRLPPEIETIKPKLNYGFTTRGCNRSCSFCVVPQKEGRFHVVGDLYDLWCGIDGVNIKLFDNNILYDHEHLKTICEQAKKHKLKIDFNQGLDFRLFTNETVKILKSVRLPPRLRFACDNPGDEIALVKKLPIINKICKEPFVYTLVGYNSTIIQDLERLEVLHLNGCRPYIMRHQQVDHDPEYSKLATYVNSSAGYYPAIGFEEYKQLTKPKKTVLTTIPFEHLETDENKELGITYTHLMTTLSGYDSREKILDVATNSFDLIFTDPPYNVNKATWDKEHNPEWFLNECARIVKVGGSILIWCSDKLLPEYLKINHPELKFQQIIHWAKPNPKPINQSQKALQQGSFKHYCSSVEYLLWWSKGDFYTFNVDKINPRYCGGNKKDVYAVSATFAKNEKLKYEDGSNAHPCQKPLSLIKAILEVHSNRADSVFDPYSGTAVVAEACIRTGRKCYSIELDVKLQPLVSKRLDKALTS